MELTREIIQRMVGRGNGGIVTGGGSGGSSGGGGGGEGGGGDTSIVDWANITSKPTTISGYGITDAYISGGAIYLGGNSITPLVSGDLNGYATQQWVGQQGFLTSSDLSGYATQQWVGQQGFATTSQLSHYLALTGGTMEDSIITPGSDSYGIYPETDRYGFIGKSTNWYWNIYGSRLYAEKMELYVYSSGSRSLYGGIDNNNFYLYPGTNSYKFNVDSNGYVTAQKFVKDGGTSSQFLKADGSSSALSASDIPDISATYATKTWVGQQNFSHGHSVYGGLTIGHLVVGDNDFSRWDMPFTFDPDDGGTVIPAFLPLSGGTLSSTLEIATAGDRKLVLNNTDNEQWNIISFQDNGTEVGYLGLRGSNALAWNQHAILLAGYDNDIITHVNEFTFASAGFCGDVSQFPNGGAVFINYRTASGNLDGNISSYGFCDGKGHVLAEISNGQFSGNAASAGALKYSGNTKVEATSSGAAVTGDLKALSLTVDAGYSTFVKQSLTLAIDGVTYNTQFYTGGSVRDNNCVFSFNGDVKTTGGLNGASLRLDYKDSTYPTNDFYLKQTIAPNGYVRQCTFAPFLSSDDSDISSTFGFKFEGTVVADNISNNSDIRLKDIIRDEAFDAESIAKMPLVAFSWKKDEEKHEHFGTIAQNWEKVIPEVVSEAPDGMKAMDYGAAAMAAGVTACREVVRLKAEIERLKEMINNK